MLRTQSLIGGLNMRKAYAMYYHVEMSEISRVNLQIGLHNEKVQDVCGNFMEHHKKRRGSGEPIQCAMVGHSGPVLLHDSPRIYPSLASPRIFDPLLFYNPT